MSDDDVFEHDDNGLLLLILMMVILLKVSDGAEVDGNDEVDHDNPLEVSDGTEGGAVRLRRQVPQLYGEHLNQTSLLFSFTLSILGWAINYIFIQYISD